jgi:hypothetical protein
MKKKWNAIEIIAVALCGIILGTVLRASVPPPATTQTTITTTMTATATMSETATFPQNGGLVYIGSITNISKSENLTYNGIRITYAPPGWVGFYTPNSSPHILMMVHYRGYFMPLVFYGNSTWDWAWDDNNAAAMGITQLDFYLLT